MIQKRRYLFILFLISCFGFAQDKMTAIEVLQKASDKYNKETYLSYNSEYKLYLDYTTTKIHEHYTGVVLKKNNVSYVKIKETEFITFKDCALKINNEQKALIYQKTKESNEPTPFSLEGYLKGFNVVFGEASKEYYICVVTPPKISQIMLSKAIVYIKKNDLTMTKQKVYFVNKMESRDAKGKTIASVPRLEIEYTIKEKNTAEDDFLVTKSNYLTENKNDVQFSKRLASYKLYKM